MLPFDTLKEISRLAVAGQPAFIKPDAEPDHVYLIRSPDGTYSQQAAIPEPSNYHASDIRTLADVVKDHHSAEPGKENVPEVWYDRSGIRAVLTPKKPYSGRCVVYLEPSPQLDSLINWSNGKHVFEQKDLILALRTIYADAAPSTLLPAVRQVKTTKAADVNQQVGHNKVSIGKSMVAEMTGAAAIPEQINFTFRMFAGPISIMGSVRIAIDLDPETGRFALIVLPGDIDAAFGGAEDVLDKRIHEELNLSFGVQEGHPIPVYRGVP